MPRCTCSTSTPLKPIGAPIPRARWAAPSWRFDSSILFYTQQRVLPPGAPAADTLRGSLAYQRVFDADGAPRATSRCSAWACRRRSTLAPDDMPSIESSPVSPFVIGVVQHGVQRELSLYVARAHRAARRRHALAQARRTASAAS